MCFGGILDKEIFRKIKKKNLEKKYIQIKIVGAFTAIVVLVFLGIRIALNNKIELAKENIEEGEIKELGILFQVEMLLFMAKIMLLMQKM